MTNDRLVSDLLEGGHLDRLPDAQSGWCEVMARVDLRELAEDVAHAIGVWRVQSWFKVLGDRVHAFKHPYPLTEQHAYAIAQSYGKVATADVAGVARLEAVCVKLRRRYRACVFHPEAQYPDPAVTSIYGDTGYISDEADGVLINLATARFGLSVTANESNDHPRPGCG